MIRNLIQSDINKVPNLAFHTMNLCEEFIVIYGGLNNIERISGDLIFLKLNKDKFMIASYDNNKSYFPNARHSHSAVFSKHKKKLYIFGGIISDNPKYSDELWTLEVSSKPIFNLLPKTGITNRCRHASFICRNRLYIYGGFGLNKITKKFQIVNDLYYFDLDKGPEGTKEVDLKGGVEMSNFLFKVVRLTEDEENEGFKKSVQFAFFCSDLTQFFILDINSETFIKIRPKFFVHSIRENFTVDRLSDGRIILFGGMNESDCYNEGYALNNFYYSQGRSESDETHNIIEEDQHYAWSDIDLNGMLSDEAGASPGFNGHASVRLPNDHILIIGGTEESFFPVYVNVPYIGSDPKFTKRCKIIDLFNSYQWDKPLKSNADKVHIYPRTLHVSQIIPKEQFDQSNLLFIHGGEYNHKMLCHYSIFDLDHEVWIPIDTNEFVPQLKAHSSCYIYEPDKKEFYVILSGGFYREHLSNCVAETNKQKERCICETELISDKIYAYKNNKFTLIEQKPLSKDIPEKLKRFGHSMITAADGCIYMLCGFAQYLGYLVDIIKFKPKIDIKNKTFYFELSSLDVGKHMPGRIYPTCQILHNNIIVYGGLKDNRTLNDLWIINLSNLTARGVDIEPKWIYPRFGMSSVVNLSPIDDKSARLIIFGGSYWSGKNLIYGMTNEVVVFNLKFTDERFSELDVDKTLPLVYGKGSVRMFHQSVYYQNKMYTFGGHNNLIVKLQMPNYINLEYIKPILDYIKEHPLIHYTSLLNSQEDEKYNKFESSSKVDKSKLDESVEEPKYNKNNKELKVNQMIELMSIEKNKEDDNRVIDKNKTIGISDTSNESGKVNLIEQKKSVLDLKKKQSVVKKKGNWDNDYK